MNVFDRCGGFLGGDGREFCGIHPYLSLTDDQTKVFHCWSIKGAFGDLK